jgi:hypothetical protein
MWNNRKRRSSYRTYLYGNENRARLCSIEGTDFCDRSRIEVFLDLKDLEPTGASRSGFSAQALKRLLPLAFVQRQLEGLVRIDRDQVDGRPRWTNQVEIEFTGFE